MLTPFFPTPVYDLSEAAGKIAHAIEVASESCAASTFYLSVAIVASVSVSVIGRCVIAILSYRKGANANNG